MFKGKSNKILVFGIISILLFLFALKLRHPYLMIGSGVMLVITYTRFRHNYVLYRSEQAKLKRREDSIEVESDEIR